MLSSETRAELELPHRIAIAGGWGYIGQKFIEASLRLGVEVFVYDPGPQPQELASAPIEVVTDEARFYALDADVFHLALHPMHRDYALSALTQRAGRGDRFLIICEKPMVDPAFPEQGPQIMKTVLDTRTPIFYDYLELFDSMTKKIHAFLSGFERVSLLEAEMHRSKDREDPENGRNYKVMVPIQYQETVHCIAFLLNLLGRTDWGLDAVWAKGVSVAGKSDVYCPPNPEAYACEVDGRVEGRMQLGNLKVQLDTNFKAGAPFTKRRVIKGMGDGRPFVIEAEYLEGHKHLRINGEDQGVASDASTYEDAVRQSWQWYRALDGSTYAGSDRYPTSLFAWYTYLISSMLWDSCKAKKTVAVESKRDLLYYSPGYAVLQRRRVYSEVFGS